MAPPDFPQGMTLHTIGYAALKFPELAPELAVPLQNQVGALQRVRPDEQDQMIAQIASQYLDALMAYQTGDDPICKCRQKLWSLGYSSQKLPKLPLTQTNS
jgi:hypothetical protein